MSSETQHPRPTAFQTKHAVGRLQVSVVSVTVTEPGPCLPETRVGVAGGKLRLVVTDPTRCWPEDRRAAATATAAAGGAVAAAEDPGTGLRDANSLLHHPYRRGDTGGQYVNVAALELGLNGLGLRAEAWRAGACELWGEVGGSWQPVFRSGPLTANARERWESQRPDRADQIAYLRARDAILSSPADWNSAPLGRFPTAQVEYSNVLPDTRVDRLLLLTDGFGAGVPDFDALARGCIRTHGATGDHLIVTISAPVEPAAGRDAGVPQS